MTRARAQLARLFPNGVLPQDNVIGEVRFNNFLANPDFIELLGKSINYLWKRGSLATIFIDAPTGLGKTSLAARIIAAITDKRMLAGARISVFLYVIPYHRIRDELADEVERLLARHIGRNKNSGYIIVHRGSDECPYADDKRRELSGGFFATPCDTCEHRVHLLFTQKYASKIRKVLKMAAREQGREHVIFDMPQDGSDKSPCFASFTRWLIQHMPALSALTLRKFGIAGIITTYDSIGTSSVALAWLSEKPKDSPRLMVLDEADYLAINPPSVHLPVYDELYSEERDLLSRFGVLDVYKRLVDMSDEILVSEETRRAIYRLSLLPYDFVKECARLVKEGKYCRLFNVFYAAKLYQLHMNMARKYNCAIESILQIGKCKLIELFMKWTRDGCPAGSCIEMRMLGYARRILFDPSFPHFNKLALSATMGIIRRPGSEPIGEAIYIKVEHKYGNLRLHIIDAGTVFRGTQLIEKTTYTEHLKEIYAIFRYALDLVPEGGSLLVVANSKEMAAEYADDFADLLGGLVRKTPDYILVEGTRTAKTVYITWYRGRFSRGTSELRDVDAVLVLHPEYDPSRVTLVDSERIAAAAVLQLIGRITRAPRFRKPKHVIVSDVVYEFVADIIEFEKLFETVERISLKDLLTKYIA